MAFVPHEIDTYQISNRLEYINNTKILRKNIILMLKGVHARAELKFDKIGRNASFNVQVNPTSNFTIFHVGYNPDEYENIIELLEFEKPLFASVDEDLGLFVLSTDKEPVGEEE